MGGGSQEETRRWVRERERVVWVKRREGRPRGSVEGAMRIYLLCEKGCWGGSREESYSSTFYDP